MSQELKNGQAIALTDAQTLDIGEFRQKIIGYVSGGNRLSSFFAVPAVDGFRLYAVLTDDKRGTMLPLVSEVLREFASMSTRCPQVHLFEREIFEQTGLLPAGHPWLKPVRFPMDAKTGNGQPSPIGIADFFKMDGEEVHEVGVGPVHAGVIEPGHFRFQCHGENVHHLEISLGYQHRGIEKQLIGSPHKRTSFQMEAIAGDTSVGHALAYCHLLEALSGAKVPLRAEAIRGVALELERLANHTGDLGALAGDVAFLPTASACGALRGDYLNMTALLCGNRLGHSMVRPGGVHFDLDRDRVAELQKRLRKTFDGTRRTIELLFDTPSAMSRFETTGSLSKTIAKEIGLVGPAARACGVDLDVRRDHPIGIFQRAQIGVSTGETSDVYARAMVRWMEIQKSVAFIEETISALPEGEIETQMPALAPGRLAVSLTEGWRGEICHTAITGSDGKFVHYKIVDPSFHNWFGLALCLRGQAIFDFPLCNKSFNLSYCGYDL